MSSVEWYPGISLEQLEKKVILQAYRYCNGNKTQAAQMLGIAIKTLYNKLEQYGLEDSRASGANSGAGTTPGEAKTLPQPGQNGVPLKEWYGLESPSEDSTEPTVSLPVGEKVQELSHEPVSTGGNNKGSRNVLKGNRVGR